jgi:transcriptional regulator with XRE-family HTH domain
MNHKTISDYLAENGKTEMEFSKELGISQAYLNEIKNGKKRPSPELAEKIEAITGIPFRVLLLSNNSSAA